MAVIDVERRPDPLDLASRGGAPALVTPDGRTVSYGELSERIAVVGRRLQGPRRLVLLEGGNTLDAIVAHLGALAGGHVVALTPARGLAPLAQRFRPDVVLTAGDGWSIPHPPRRPHHDDLHPDLALLLSTSGSTGSPKLVRLSHENVWSNAHAIAEYLRLGPDDCGITSLPMHYCYGLSVLHSHLAAGGALALTDLSVSETCFWRQFERAGVTGLAGVPHTFDLLDRAGFADRDLPSLRSLTQAGGRLHPDKVRRHAEHARARGRELYVMYGQTEATARMAFVPPDQILTAPTAIGRAIPGGELRIDSPDGDGIGEIVYRGPNVMLGYAECARDLALGRTIDELRTGDLGRRRPDGLFEVVGRTSRFIKPFGLRIDLDALEARLTAEVGAAGPVDVVCTGDDERLVVAAPPGADEQIALLARTSTGLPSTHVDVVALDDIPRLENGKPDHRRIRDLASASTAPTSTPATVREVLASVCGRDPRSIQDHDTFVGLGGDSLSYVEAASRLEPVIGELPDRWHLRRVIDLEALAAHRTAADHPDRRHRRSVQLETNVVVRAAAMALIVGSHAHLFTLQGGAHVLLAVAGFNFARFALGSDTTDEHVRRTSRGILRVLVPTWIWLAFQFTYAEPLRWERVLLVANYAGKNGQRLWEYWYIEVLLQILLVVSALFAWGRLRRFEQRRGFEVAVGALALATTVRWVRPTYGFDQLLYRPDTALWCFALGWAAARARTTPQRLLVTVLGAAALPGYFDKPERTAIAAVGLAILVWTARLRLPRHAAPVVNALAAASLTIFLTQWAVIPVADPLPPLVGTAATLAVGVGTHRAVTCLRGRYRVVEAVRAASSRRHARRPQNLGDHLAV